MNCIDTQYSPKDYNVREDDIAVYSRLIEPSEPNWWEAVRAELQGNNVKVLSTLDDITTAGEEDDFDKEVKQPAIKSVRGNGVRRTVATLQAVS